MQEEHPSASTDRPLWPREASVDEATLRHVWKRAFADGGYELVDLFASWGSEDEWIVLRKPRHVKVQPELLYARVPPGGISSPSPRQNWDAVESFERQWCRGQTKQTRVLEEARRIRTSTAPSLRRDGRRVTSETLTLANVTKQTGPCKKNVDRFARS